MPKDRGATSDVLPDSSVSLQEEFVKTIKKEYPHMMVFEGTHPFHDVDAFKAGIKEVTSQRPVTPRK